jgi:hypothetical protein
MTVNYNVCLGEEIFDAMRSLRRATKPILRNVTRDFPDRNDTLSCDFGNLFIH